MDQNKLRRMAGLPQVISEKYETSADWDADFDKLETHVAQALQILNSANWKQHIADTEANFDVKVKQISDALKGELEQANGTLAVLMHTMEKAA